MNAKAGWVLGGAAALAAAIAIACSGGSTTPAACNAGDTRQCVGAGACAGGQVCSGGTWSACDCGGGGDAGNDTSTAGDAGVDAAPDITPYLKNCPQVAQQAPMVEIPSDGGTFCIDTREVTAAEFEPMRHNLPMYSPTECISPPAPKPILCPTQDYSSGSAPASCVMWCLAYSFCKDEGKRLCTEAEIGAACAPGGVDFPWGEDAGAPSARCFTQTVVPAAQSECRPPQVPDYFVKDLAGGVHEWTATPRTFTTYWALSNYKPGDQVCGATMVAPSSMDELSSFGFRCCADRK